MADITKCTNTECKLKYFCKRHNANSSEHWQSWSDLSDFDKSGKKCGNRIPDECPVCGGKVVHKLSCGNRYL